MELSPDQMKAVRAAASGKNVGIFGPGGVGKTTVQQKILENLDSIFICTLTGLLAVSEGGTTLHSFLWLKQHDEVNAETLPHFIKQGTKALKSPRHSHHELFSSRDRITIVLVEISQWSRWQFELLEKVVKSVSSRPGKMWGGHQLIVTGDFMQAPPVMPGLSDPYSASCIYSDMFARSIDAAVNLTTQHRQRGGGEDVAQITVDVNHEVRKAQLQTSFGMDNMNETFAHVVYRTPIDTEQACKDGFILLTKTRKRRDQVNAQMLSHFEDTVVVQPFRKNAISEPVTFATGAPIMFHVRSIGKRSLDNGKSETLKAVNGTQGTFMGWKGPLLICKETPSFADVEIDGTIYTFPMHLHFGSKDTPPSKQKVENSVAIRPPFDLSFAMTIAKSQGLTLDRVVCDYSGLSMSDLYIVVSRLRNIRNLYPSMDSGRPYPEFIHPVEGLVPVVELFNRMLEEKS